MRPCPRCGRDFAEVRGAREQACPWCGLVFEVDAPAPSEPDAAHVDPVAALGLAARTARSRYPALLAWWTPFVLIEFALAYAIERVLPEDLGGLGFQAQLRLLGIALPALLALGALAFAGWSVAAAAAFGDPRALARRVGALVGLGLLLTLTLLAGALLLLVPFLVFFHWFLYAPAALAEGRGVGQAFEASRAFARRHRTYGFTALVLLAYVAYSLLAYGLGNLLVAPLEAAGLSRAGASALAGALGAWPFAPVFALLPASYWRLASDAPARTAAPAATGGRRTTTCPTCGRLVPRPDGEGPVTVTCTGCGAVGRVH